MIATAIPLMAALSFAQIFLPPRPPDPSQYGSVLLDNYSKTGPGPVVFDHWLHRSKFTCRVCHIDIGFAMQAKATGINAKSNRQGFHCGACHDGKRVFEGRTIFAACAEIATGQCDRCHSVGKKQVRKFEYKEFTSRLPKARYGIDWEAAERNGAIKLVDFVEGVSIPKPHMQNRQDFPVQPSYSWVQPINFSHEMHAIWNGCELCHPEIFPTARKGETRFSMFHNTEGRFCGACHGKVAFPLNQCRSCHSGGPYWAP